MLIRDVDYSHEGISLRGYFVRDDSLTGPVPGVLVVHDAGGLSENMKEKARRIAQLGYAAFALDLWGGGKPVTDGMQRLQALGANIPLWRGLANAGLAQLAMQPSVDPSKLGAIGYCFGGTTVYELARSGAELKAVVGFHSALGPRSGEARNIKGKVLVQIGAEDPLIPPESRMKFEAEMREAKVDWQMNIFGNTAHSFTNPTMNQPGFFYQPASDARSWAEMRRLFEEALA